MNRKTVAVLPGDGIGPEVLDAALPVIETLGLPVDLEFGDIGWEYWRTEGNPVPDRTWDLIGRSDAVLLGATTSKPRREALAELAPELRASAPQYISPIIQLRQRLDLFANLRPVENYLGGGTPYRFCVVRENTEGLYAGLDWNHVPDEMWPLVADHPNVRRSGRQGATASVRLQTSHGLDRILRFAFETARGHGHERVTLADKPNVLRHSSAYVLERLEAIAADYPEIPFEVLNVDAVALWMARRPERFGVIVAENMFGDILSDLGGGVMGGLGLAPSANIGETGNYFEPVHGSAPAMAGHGRANPAAAFLTIGLLLEHLGFEHEARGVRDAVRHVTRRATGSLTTWAAAPPPPRRPRRSWTPAARSRTPRPLPSSPSGTSCSAVIWRTPTPVSPRGCSPSAASRSASATPSATTRPASPTPSVPPSAATT
ncbi:isocitrate/isopropylmalate dehydrogenase family protein [Streptomyces kaempferi]